MKTLGLSNYITFEYGNDIWKIKHVMGGCEFALETDKVKVIFTAEGRNGSTYTKIKSVWNKINNRVYTAQSFTYKYISLVCEAGYILAKNDYLWDYEAQKPLSVTREESLKAYYAKCRELGLPTNDPIYDKMHVQAF